MTEVGDCYTTPASHSAPVLRVLGILADRFFIADTAIIKCDSYFQTGHWRLVTAYSATLQFNAKVFVHVNFCFAANLNPCVFEVDSFVDKS